MTRQEIIDEINMIEDALACDDSMPSSSFSVAEAEERLKYLYELLADDLFK